MIARVDSHQRRVTGKRGHRGNLDLGKDDLRLHHAWNVARTPRSAEKEVGRSRRSETCWDRPSRPVARARAPPPSMPLRDSLAPPAALAVRG